MIEVLFCLASLVAQMVKNLPAMQETWVRSLGWEDPLEKEIATHFCTLAWEIPCTEEKGALYSPWGCRELDTTERLNNNNSNLLGPEGCKVKETLPWRRSGQVSSSTTDRIV